MRTPEDPLSQVLFVAEAQAAVSTGLEARGAWALSVSPAQVLKCNVVRTGQCWLDAGGTQWRLEVGDCFLVAPGHAFVLGSDLSLPPIPAEQVFAGSGSAPFARLDGGAGADFRSLGGRMELPASAELLTSALPVVAVLRSDSQAAQRIGWLLDRLEEESTHVSPGREAVSSALMQLVFIELFRGLPHVQTGGWLAALADPRLGPALQAIHREPGRSWKVSDLADVASLSRSRFARRFHDVVGRSPMDYVLHWRMALATRRLAEPGSTVAEVAEALGYSSESAFGAAYRRATGHSPRGQRISR